MTTAPAPVQAPVSPGPQWGRLVTGLLVVVAGTAWLIDGLGVPVPWRALPAAALIVVGLTVVVAGRVSGTLAVLGGLLLAAALVCALPVDRFAGPVGEHTVAPALSQWPVDTRISAGTLLVDLTDRPLPPGGRVDVGVGIGRLALVVPWGDAVRIDASVGTGDIEVDGESVDSGFGARWTQDGAAPHAVVVDAQVGTGVIEVSHE